MLYVWQRLLKVRLDTFQKPNILRFQDFKILSSQSYIIDAYPWIIFILAGFVLQGQHSLTDENYSREQLMVMEGRWPPGQQVTGFHCALMFWEANCDRITAYHCVSSSFSHSSRHSLEAHSKYIRPSLPFIERCWGKAFCLTCQELASNGIFPMSIKQASPSTVSVITVKHWPPTSRASCTHRRTSPQLYFYLTLLWKTGLECLCLSAQYEFSVIQYI